MIRNFRHASALTYLSHDKVQAGYIWENRELFIEPPEHVHKIYDLRKLDTWDVGITLYRVLSATPPKKVSFQRNCHRAFSARVKMFL
jgi:hypothetical protein